jgi:hypothetical protein
MCLILVSNETEESSFGACGWILIVCSYILVVITFPITAFFCINVSEDEILKRELLLFLGGARI